MKTVRSLTILAGALAPMAALAQDPTAIEAVSNAGATNGVLHLHSSVQQLLHSFLVLVPSWVYP